MGNTQKKQSLQQQYIENYFPKVENKFLQYVIYECLRYKVASYLRFLILKQSLKEIQHRKIVHKIYLKYQPQQRFELKCSLLMARSFREGGCVENMKCLGEGMKYIPVYQQKLALYLRRNDLGRNVDNMKYLRECIMQLPQNLQHLELHLYENQLGGNMKVLFQFGECMKQLPGNLKVFILDLSSNELGVGKMERLRGLGNFIQYLPRSLQEFTLDLSYNKLGGNQVQKFREENLLVFSRLKKFELLY